VQGQLRRLRPREATHLRKEREGDPEPPEVERNTAHCDVGARFLRVAQQVCDELRLHPVVGIHHGDELPAGDAQACVPRRSEATVGLADGVHLGMLLFEAAHDDGRVVGGTVVHHDDLERPVGLREQGVQASRKVTTDVEGRNDDAHQSIH